MNQQVVSINEAIRLLNEGGVGVMPTDTVYGLVARANDPQAAARLYKLKHRESKPGTIIAANTSQLLDLGVDRHHIDRIKHLWPNSISIETPLGANLTYLHQGTGRQGFRVVADEKVRRILEQTGPLVTSSANHPGLAGAINVVEAWNYFKDSVDFYIDGGDRSNQPPSTIVKLNPDNSITIIRQGAVILPSDPTATPS